MSMDNHLLRQFRDVTRIVMCVVVKYATDQVVLLPFFTCVFITNASLLKYNDLASC